MTNSVALVAEKRGGVVAVVGDGLQFQEAELDSVLQDFFLVLLRSNGEPDVCCGFSLCSGR